MAETGTMMLLPPRQGLCQTCGSQHEPHEPHNAQSLYYGVAFQMQHGRAPTWSDALAHCAPEIQEAWRNELIRLGVDVDAGEINPKRKSKRARHV